MRPSVLPLLLLAILCLPAAPSAAGEPAPTAQLDPREVSELAALLASRGNLAEHSAAPDEAAAFEKYQSTGEPPVLTRPTETVLPFGHQVPRITCLPLRACDVKLQAGETVVGWALGDTERWHTDQLIEGEPPQQRPHLLLKPTAYGVATNLVIVTDRRSYHLELHAPGRDELDADEPAPYASRVSWWYPQDWVRRSSRREAATSRAAAERAAAVVQAAHFDPANLAFGYRLEQPWWPSRRLGWEPSLVFDDGKRVFLRLPPRAMRSELPAVLGVLDGTGEGYPLNARVDGEWLVIPSLFDSAELVLGTGKRRRSLRIVAPDAGERR